MYDLEKNTLSPSAVSKQFSNITITVCIATVYMTPALLLFHIMLSNQTIE